MSRPRKIRQLENRLRDIDSDGNREQRRMATKMMKKLASRKKKERSSVPSVVTRV